jgi:hypothetical protein
MNPPELTIVVDRGADATPEETDEAARELLTAVLRDVPSISFGRLAADGTAPTGSKSVTAAAIGAIIVSALPTVFPDVVDFLKRWLLRDRRSSIKLRIATGDGSVDLEYDPRVMSDADVTTLVGRLSATIAPR